MNLNKLLFLAGLIFLFLQSRGQEPAFKTISDTEAVKRMIRENARNTSSVSSDFVQEKHLTMMEEVLVSKGRFLFKKENKVRWEYTEPVSYAIIVNGPKFIINNEGRINEFDAVSNPLFREINDMIMMAISGDFVDNPDFTPSFFEDDKTILVKLKPVDEMLSSMLTGIEIYFSKPSLQVEMMKFIEPGDDFTLTRFQNRQENKDIADELFHAE